MAKSGHSELEGFVLGLVWQFGPCSAYDVRKHLLDSPSTQWSGSAGAIYPLIRKLAGLRLMAASRRTTGRRQRTMYLVTPRGIAHLRRWIGPPLAPEVITVPHDPLRSRVRFLSALPEPDRHAWIVAALAGLEQVERRIRGWQSRHGSYGDRFLAALTRQAEADIRTRKRWLKELDQRAGD